MNGYSILSLLTITGKCRPYIYTYGQLTNCKGVEFRSTWDTGIVYIDEDNETLIGTEGSCFPLAPLILRLTLFN